MTAPLVITLPYPPSANRYWSTRVVEVKATGKLTAVTYVSDDAKAYKNRVAWMVRAAGVRAPIEGRVAFHVRLYPNRPQDWQTRQRKMGAAWDDSVQCIDLDNANKVLLDALKGVAIVDDKWVRQLHCERMEPDGGDARVMVAIIAIPAEQPQVDLLEAAL